MPPYAVALSVVGLVLALVAGVYAASFAQAPRGFESGPFLSGARPAEHDTRSQRRQRNSDERKAFEHLVEARREAVVAGCQAGPELHGGEADQREAVRCEADFAHRHSDRRGDGSDAGSEVG